MKLLSAKTDPNDFDRVDLKMNDAVPSDHNLTIYEACLIYGPTFPQAVKPFNFSPKNFDWFFTLFTPLSDIRFEYNDQVFIGLDWGASEVMVNADISIAEASNTGFKNIMGALMGLPRADASISESQKILIEQEAKSGQKILMFTHFTLINYDMSVPLLYQGKIFKAGDNVFNEYTKGTFSQNRRWLYSQINNRFNYTFAGHSHRSAVYRLENTNLDAMFTLGYHPTEYGQTSAATSAMHNKIFVQETSTRVVVSSCGGPIGVQNLKGELYGWNLMPPSGTLIDTKEKGEAAFRRVITKKYLPSKPRFCVALDYLQVLLGSQVISWISMEKNGHYWVVMGNVLDCKHCIEKLTFYVWDASGQTFLPFEVAIAPLPEHPTAYNAYFHDPQKFFQKALSRNIKIPNTPTFVQINFNQTLAKSELYCQYNFDDPWIFRVDIEAHKDHPLISPAGLRKAEVPDWQWLATVDPQRYSKPLKNKG